ncbi:hypothetical protein CC1G_04153 [Coprinopsis cinerea okayama7|uniref:Uncharacterized protein n=1 Tax=Coprinopsis cinerea (strain Okayama-7 / 130 / ATCC MYA-4618 / FGSC 9003) TaxID=240176 RepID=A8NW64_COPC7|nr:hypothetical protein CC1G_04153 [Coprinopsis cinerea okayama7\|eukprot:XP_001836840.2 hypothetical protein CC1G_04153 [Coprinopsis cinerea okayama7\
MAQAGCRVAPKELLLRFTALLVRFSLDPKDFRACMMTHGAVVSGSAALAVILPRPSSFVPNDIDIYVNSSGLSGLLKYILTRTPYTKETVLTRARGPDVAYSVLVGGTAMLTVRLLEDPLSGRSLNVVEASTRSPLSVVWGFHSTLVMNVVLHSGVGSAYPRHALEGVGVINCVRGRMVRRPALVQALDKYRRRGFRLYANLVDVFASQDRAVTSTPALSQHHCGTWAYCPQTTRDSLDPGMLWVPFPGYTSDDMLQGVPSVSWKLAHDGECCRELAPCPGWLEDVDGRRASIVTGF